MTASIIVLCLLAALLELDTTYAGQWLISRPIIAGPLFGLITGDLMAGIQVGVFAELLFVDISPLGGIIPPSGVMTAAIPMILYSLGIELCKIMNSCRSVCENLVEIWRRKKIPSPW